MRIMLLLCALICAGCASEVPTEATLERFGPLDGYPEAVASSSDPILAAIMHTDKINLAKPMEPDNYNLGCVDSTAAGTYVNEPMSRTPTPREPR